MNILVDYYLDHRPPHEVIGVDPEVTENWDFETMNEIMFQRDRHQPLERVLAEIKSAYAKVLARLESMTFDERKIYSTAKIRLQLEGFALRTCEMLLPVNSTNLILSPHCRK
jgi:hypothetical protein